MPRTDSSLAAGQGLLGAATENGHEMQIFVTTATGKTITLSACDSDSGAVVKARLQNLEGIPANKQSIFYGKRQLEDDHTLAGCGVRREGTLRLVITQPDAAMRSGRSGATNAMMLSGLSTEDAAASSINRSSGATSLAYLKTMRCGRPHLRFGLAILGVIVLCAVVALSVATSEPSRAPPPTRAHTGAHRTTFSVHPCVRNSLCGVHPALNIVTATCVRLYTHLVA